MLQTLLEFQALPAICSQLLKLHGHSLKTAFSRPLAVDWMKLVHLQREGGQGGKSGLILSSP
jgi:hypothetical protein